jgi:hypothetical protein
MPADRIDAVDVAVKLSSRSVSSQPGTDERLGQVDGYSVAVAALTGSHRIPCSDEQAEFLRLTASTATTS